MSDSNSRQQELPPALKKIVKQLFEFLQKSYLLIILANLLLIGLYVYGLTQVGLLMKIVMTSTAIIYFLSSLHVPFQEMNKHELFMLKFFAVQPCLFIVGILYTLIMWDGTKMLYAGLVFFGIAAVYRLANQKEISEKIRELLKPLMLNALIWTAVGAATILYARSETYQEQLQIEDVNETAEQ